jgi:hypothetical protein
MKRRWKEVVMAKFVVLSQHIHGGTKETNEKPPDRWFWPNI